MTTVSRAFADGCVHLPNCSLNRDISKADALALGHHLSLMDPWKALGVSEDTLADYLSRLDPALFRYAVWVDNKLAGVVCIRYPWLRGPYIELLAIIKDFQNLRLGSEIMTFAEREARLVSKNLWVVTSEFNLKARQFYQRHGFIEISRLPDLVKPDFVEILLRKTWF